ncbi:MAG: glycerophosphodiester phosphodiesterase [Mycoplasmatales bacterium]|nr:glycerophosphodiester phosphodiesterase [Mycoplasmatales bacterium]
MKINVLAHRGYSEIAPENTDLAFKAAEIFEFDGIEIDIHMTKDKKLVVIHDEDILRTSNGSGKIKNLTLEQLRKFNFSSKFDNNFSFQKIMTYEELLLKYGNKFKVINTEIKTDVIHYEGIEKLIWEIHSKINPEAEIIYSSFNFESLKIMRKISNEAKLGFLFVDYKDCLGKENEIKKICDYIHPWFKSMLNKKSSDLYNELNLPLNLWTFDKKYSLNKWTRGSNKALQEILKFKNIYSIISNSKYKI